MSVPHKLMRAFAARLAAVAALVLCAPALSQAQELRLGMGADVTSIDPHFVNLFPNNNIALHIFDSLVLLDADSRLIPGLATSWKLVDDNTWEFKLRPGVKWHDGSDFTAEDVAYSIERVSQVKNSPGPFTVYTKAIVKSEIVDPLTIRFKTASVYPLLPNDLSAIYIMSKKASQGLSTEDLNAGRGQIGTGPYKFVSFKRGDRVELLRNDNYWGGKGPWEKVTIRILANDPTRIAALLSGDVQAIENIPTADFAKLKANPNIDVSTKVSHRIIFFHIDTNRKVAPFVTDKAGKPLEVNPFRDLRVRQAISKAIDREAIKNRVMEGLAVPTANLVPAPMFGHNPALKPDKFDPEGAKKLLAEAGYPNGFGMTLFAPNNRYVNDDQIAQAVASMLTRVGIQTKVETMPMGVYLGRASRLEFSFAMLGWGASTAESSSPLRSHLVSYDPAKGMGSFAWGRYSHPEVDRLTNLALGTKDDRAREKLLQDATAIAINDLGIIPIHHQINTWATKKGITYTPRTDEYTLAFYFRPK
ncbi:MAG TPA: ABC transporter substrate-binding protein [Burkholderiales bacterium]|jgi:peptide/nickel transport system substrate-binding protein|nr:ABC transporter substrate-binding protein [Burkholderiales bacterium]